MILSVIYLLASCFICYSNTPEQLPDKFTAPIKPIIISLGMDCQVALQLRNHNLRYQAFPFDWIITPHFSTIYRVLQDNFSHFLLRNYLIAQADKVIDTYYGITFIHDFPTKLYPNGTPNTDFDINVMPAQVLPNYLNFLPQVKQKFDRRIERLQQVLHSTHPVIFIRVHHIGKPEALAFTQLIKARYPQLNFTLVAIHTDIHAQSDWQIPRVKSFYTNKFIPHDPRKWLLDHEWTRILKELRLI